MSNYELLLKTMALTGNTLDALEQKYKIDHDEMLLIIACGAFLNASGLLLKDPNADLADMINGCADSISDISARMRGVIDLDKLNEWIEGLE